MKIPRRTRTHAALEGDTMTPMIDVVFLLLVFFICASVGGTADPLLPAELKGSEPASTIPLPEDSEEEWEHPAIQIRLEPAADGVVVKLDDQRLEGIAELTSRLTQLAAVDPDSRVVLNIHDDISVQQFIGVYDLCQGLKFNNISFAVTAPAR